jgi:hypothetical protein
MQRHLLRHLLHLYAEAPAKHELNVLSMTGGGSLELTSATVLSMADTKTPAKNTSDASMRLLSTTGGGGGGGLGAAQLEVSALGDSQFARGQLQASALADTTSAKGVRGEGQADWERLEEEEEEERAADAASELQAVGVGVGGAAGEEEVSSNVSGVVGANLSCANSEVV